MKTTFLLLLLIFFTCSCSHNTNIISRGDFLKIGPALWCSGTIALLENRENTKFELSSTENPEIGADSSAKLPNEFNASVEHKTQITRIFDGTCRSLPGSSNRIS